MNEQPPKFSLIVATIGRTTPLERLFETLRLQTCQSFEVIVVDQNPPGYLQEVLAPFQALFPILHLRSGLGLSHARNIALSHIRGEFVAIPDDDCWYPENLLECVAERFASHPEWDALTGMLVDPENPGGFKNYHKTSGRVGVDNIINRSTSVTIFLRRDVVERVGRFDEDLGRGARTGMTSCEEAEYLVRALLLDIFVFYSPDLRVFHPSWKSHDETQIERAFGDSRAFAHISRKYRLPLWVVLRRLTRSIAAMIWFTVNGSHRKTRYHWRSLLGFLSGWLSYRKPHPETRQELTGRLS